MPDHEGRDQRHSQLLGELFRSTASPATDDLAEALEGLDRATKSFARRLWDGDLPAAPPPSSTSPRNGTSFDVLMREAEQEARAYLEDAKRRADTIVATMVGAVEREAAELRREAEEGIRVRWQQAESDAEHHVESASRTAEMMVAERQARIAALSDGISERAVALTIGMDDAEQVRAQFDAFVRVLSVAADRIASGSEAAPRSCDLHEIQGACDAPPGSAIAA